MNNKFALQLSYEELLLLDGKVNEEAQKIIDNAKKEDSFGLDDFSNTIIRQAIEKGKLDYNYCNISSCNFCDKKSGYETYDRTTRYHRKGEKNYKKPFSYHGIKPFSSFIIFNGMSGVCSSCWFDKFFPTICEYILKNDLKVELPKIQSKNNCYETKYFKDKVRICFKCKEKMFESEMRESYTIFGDGKYKSTCPHCGAEQKAFGTVHETTNEFRMITKDELEKIKKGN